MKSLLLFWMLWLNPGPQHETLWIKGKVVLKGDQEGMPGVKVSLSEATPPVFTSVDGTFLVQVKRKSSYALRLEFSSMASIQVTGIEGHKQDTVDVGNIEMIPNRVISEKEYTALDQSTKQKTYPWYCYATLLGYVLLNEVEAKDLNSGCEDQPGRPYHYPYDPITNTITKDYKRIKECR